MERLTEDRVSVLCEKRGSFTSVNMHHLNLGALKNTTALGPEKIGRMQQSEPITNRLEIFC